MQCSGDTLHVCVEQRNGIYEIQRKINCFIEKHNPACTCVNVNAPFHNICFAVLGFFFFLKDLLKNQSN